jgi:hypothetical protein
MLPEQLRTGAFGADQPDRFALLRDINFSRKVQSTIMTLRLTASAPRQSARATNESLEYPDRGTIG